MSMSHTMTPYELANATGRSPWSLEDIRDEMTDEEWDAYCESAMLDALEG